MPARRTILLVDDDRAVRMPIKGFLQTNGFEVLEAESIATTLTALEKAAPDVALIDFSLPDGDGLELIRRLKGMDTVLPVIMLTGHGTIDLAVKAMKEGAEQFFTKPVELSTLKVVIERVLENQRNRKASIVGKSSKARASIDPFGEDPGILRIAAESRRVASAQSPVLIRGETGSGKGVLARWLHDNSPRSEEAFVEVNCAGLSRELLESELFGHEKGAFTGAVTSKMGLLELAHRGSLFLDEIGDVDLPVQAKLLKVLEDLRFRRLGDVRDRQVDFRLIAATHRDLEQLVAEQKFREDLLYRINALPIVLPPLRERGEDVIRIAQRLLGRIGSEMGRPGLRLSEDAKRAILGHPWPGNVRQLRNVLERAALLSEADVVPGQFFDAQGSPAPSEPPAQITLDEAERRYIESVLRAQGGIVPQAAKILGLSRSALYAKLKKHGLGTR